MGRLVGGSFRIINEHLIKVKIPPDEKPETQKKLSLSSEEGQGTGEDASAAATPIIATFDILPVEPSLISITEIRPDKGISGDLIAVYGINFTEQAKVSIGTTEVTKVTFVDNTQLNIMIPPCMASAIKTLNIKIDQETASKPFRIL